MIIDEVEGKKIIINENDKRVKIGNLYQVFNINEDVINLYPFVYQLDKIITTKNGWKIFSLILMNQTGPKRIKIESDYLYEINR